MTVYFIGAGPGAADLLTIRGRRLIRRCGVCLYAGSLIPDVVVAEARARGHEVIDTAPMTLEAIIERIVSADRAGMDVARVHSGDPALYSAVGEQARALADHGIAYEIVPGVPSYAAAAAAAGCELTLPDVCQTVVLTRMTMTAGMALSHDQLADLARQDACLAIHLSIRDLRRIVASLIPVWGEDCPILVAVRVSWPDEKLIWGRLADIAQTVRREKITRTALIMVGPSLRAATFARSKLYDGTRAHLLRPVPNKA
ncbi:MAG: precorrin-4 C(11)-methyltransferase [Pseudomonadota bacterium]